MISPIAAAIAPSVIMLKVYPMAYRTISVRQIVTGMVIRIVRLAFSDRRNITATKMASASPIQRLSVTLFTEVFTKSAWI